jgi:site-specific DNA-methyltransferase (adenine-specific)
MKQNRITNVDDMNVSPACGKPLVMGSTVFNEDCMTVMARYPDKFFDLAVVDVPYGISVDEWMAKDSNTQRGKSATKRGEYDAKQWDKVAPNNQYFYELIRVSKNQIVWGANHFISRMPFDSSCWLVWDKENGENGYADCELAWTSFDKAVRMVKYKWHGMLQKDMKNKEQRIHPTQKPVGLYDWIFTKFSEPEMKVLYTHLGSGSSRIAAHKHNLEFVGCEIDAEYFAAQEARFKEFTSQLRLFG